MKASSTLKVILSSIFIVLFFVFNLVLAYQTITKVSSNPNNISLQLGVSGLLFFLAFITLIQYFFFKEPTYYYYVLYLLLYLCYYTLIFSYSTNLGNEFMPYFTQIRPALSLLVLVSSYGIYTLFAISFLSLKTKDKILYKWLKILSYIYLFMFIIIFISYIFFSAEGVFGDTLRTIMISCCIPLGIVGIVLIYKRAKNIFGYILCAGSTFIFVGSVLGFLFSFKILNYPSNKFPLNNWLFYTIAGNLLEVVMFFSSFAYRNKTLTNEEQIAKERLQVIRDEISRDLHDDVGASLSNINILNELAKRNANNPEKANEYLVKAGEDIQQVSESLHDIVWNINSKYDDLNNLFIRMRRYAADMMDGKNIIYEIKLPENTMDLKLPMDKRKDLYFIFKEAINNLVKYSDATKATVEISIRKEILILQITDNGKGFSSDKIQIGNGLQNMQHRAQFWNAPFKIESGKGSGTSICLEMALN
jgi:signal transduction histidine kinase